MLTEPLTSPPTKTLRILYGVLTGFLFAPFVHIGSIYFTPELALVFGNIFVYFVSPKEKLILKLKELKEVGKDTFDFIFAPDRKFSFVPGQYMEWTLGHKNTDNRGNRRYFTLASSPTEKDIRMGVRFYPESSSFKNELKALKPGDTIVAGSRAGDFTLPKNKSKKLVFVAGGIGITPFRSMIKYLVDYNEKRDIVLFYSNKKIEDVAYTEVFDGAYEKLGIRTVYTLTDKTVAPVLWRGELGHIDANMIRRNVPGFLDRTYYISGPNTMVKTFKNTLVKMGIEKSQIITDFFPGF
jgi:ferredoxin-NADP reductase